VSRGDTYASWMSGRRKNVAPTPSFTHRPRHRRSLRQAALLFNNVNGRWGCEEVINAVGNTAWSSPRLLGSYFFILHSDRSCPLCTSKFQLSAISVFIPDIASYTKRTMKYKGKYKYKVVFHHSILSDSFFC